MPTLNWIGKEKVVNHHLDVPFRTLEKQYTYASEGQDDGGNMIIHGDNLDALWDMLSTIHEDTHITLSSSVLMLNALDAYGTKILQTFYEADAENDHITFELV